MKAYRRKDGQDGKKDKKIKEDEKAVKVDWHVTEKLQGCRTLWSLK